MLSKKNNIAAKRVFDILVSSLLLLICLPIVALAALGVKISSPGPVLYRALRVGRHGNVFEMLKLRTMHTGTASISVITAPGDSRIFPFGKLIRDLKIDELPQLWNVLIGEMSIVGPRAEDPKIVSESYSDWMKETLSVAPGLTSPGAIYGYMYSDMLLDEGDPESSYIGRLLHPKLALERAYINNISIHRDVLYIFLTIFAIAGNVFGRRTVLPDSDITAARQWAPQGPYPTARV